MSSGRKKSCFGCNRKFANNETLAKHMIASTSCKKFVKICPGCNKICASEDHLSNHQKQRQKDGFFCYDSSTKLEMVSTLGLDTLKNSGVSISKRQENETVFAVEQMVPPKKTNVATSVESFYGLELLNSFHNAPKFLTPTEKLKSILDHPLHHHDTSEDTNPSKKKRAKSLHNVIQSEVSPSQCKDSNIKTMTAHDKVLFPQNDVTFLGVSDVEKERIISGQVGLYHTHHSSRNFNLFKGQRSDGTSYNVCAPTTDSTELDLGLPNSSEDQEDEDLLTYFEEHNLVPPSNDNGNTRTTVSNSDALNIENQSGIIDETNGLQQRESVFPVNNTNSLYIEGRCKFNESHSEHVFWEDADIALIELYSMHKKCRAPIGLFDDTLKWLKRNYTRLTNKRTGELNKIKHRTSFVKTMYEKVYGKDNIGKVKPTLLQVDIPNMRSSIHCTLFDFREVMVSLLSNKAIMDPNNLLFYDDSDPTKIHPVGSPIDSVISSDVFRLAHKRLCVNQNDVLWPLAIYNDEINIDHNGKLKLDPLSVSFLRLRTEVRNQHKAWRTFGMVHNLESSAFESKDLTSLEKIRIHHTILEKVYKMIEILQKENVGIPWKLQMKNGSYHNVNLKIYIQFVIGDTKGHDEHCGRMSSHNVQLEQCVRDCHVASSNSDNASHRCKFRKISDVKDQDKECRKAQSFHDVNICYDKLDLGDHIHGIFGATCGEPLHMLGMGLHQYLVEEFVNHLSASSSRTIKQAVMNIVPLATRQSAAKFVPLVSSFRNGITGINILTADERFARLYVILIALLTSDCAERIATNPPKRTDSNVESRRASYGTALLQSWVDLIESMLCITLWLKESVFPADQIYNKTYLEKWEEVLESNNIADITSFIERNSDRMSDAAQKRIIKLLKDYHALVGSQGSNGLKIPKFHLMLHIVRNIIRHGPVVNYDTARHEANAKESGKTPALRTQMNHNTISYQTALRNHEDMTIETAELLFHESCIKFDQKNSQTNNYSYFGKVCNDTQSNKNLDVDEFTSEGSSRYIIVVLKDGRTDSPMALTSQVRWMNKTPNKCFDTDLLLCLSNWLWYDPRGGCITKSSYPKGFTEIQLNGNTYRAHPSYRDKGSWYDWAFIKWEGTDDLIPAKIYMFFELDPNTTQFLNEHDIDNSEFLLDTESDTSHTSMLPASLSDRNDNDSDFIRQHQYWAVIHSAEAPSIAEDDYPSEYHLKSSLSKRIKMETKKFRLIPISAITSPAYVMANQSLVGSNYDNTAIVLDTKDTWAETFISASLS